MTGYSQTNYNYYQDEKTIQEPKQSTETTSKTKNENEEGENTATDVSGKCITSLCIQCEMLTWWGIGGGLIWLERLYKTLGAYFLGIF